MRSKQAQPGSGGRRIEGMVIGDTRAVRLVAGAVVVAGLCVLAGILAWQRAGSRDGSAEVTIFCGVALGVGIGGFYVFLKLIFAYKSK